MQVGFGDSKPAKNVKEEFNSSGATGVVLDNWRRNKVAYDEAKARLDESKENVISHLQGKIDVGTNRFATNHFVLKTTMNVKYDVDSSDMNRLNILLNNIALKCGAEVASNLLKWKPSLNVKVYDSLPDDVKQELNSVITMSYSSPTLYIEEK